jgi:hypothetical protein
VALVLSSAIAAFGTVVSAYVAVVANKTRRAVNGRHDELELRVQLLEQLLSWAREDLAAVSDERREQPRA